MGLDCKTFSLVMAKLHVISCATFLILPFTTMPCANVSNGTSFSTMRTPNKPTIGDQLVINTKIFVIESKSIHKSQRSIIHLCKVQTIWNTTTMQTCH